ncbi:DEAD-box ATP-dependent RNA helicase 9-like [Pecten maximus]|uniref:DEAD-box ATP-dependent RNA helicase 9-like n=1 Tax=Pecten maximus TaxID=6579 RepID=UPI001458BBD4|nr:DEAD-box ATP-dependent RNA helicase 9-like [Pecten maximus]
MLQLLFTVACLIACVLCNSYRRPSYGQANVGVIAKTGVDGEGRRVSGSGGRIESGFSGRRGGAVFERVVSGRRGGTVLDDVVSGRRGGAVFDDVVSGRRGGAVFDGVVSGRRGGAIFDGVVSGRKGAGVVGNKRRGVGFGFEDFVSGRRVGSGVADRFGGPDIGTRGNDDVVAGRTERRWGQGSNIWSDRRDDGWTETRGSQVRPNIPAKSYN